MKKREERDERDRYGSNWGRARPTWTAFGMWGGGGTSSQRAGHSHASRATCTHAGQISVNKGHQWWRGATTSEATQSREEWATMGQQ